MKTNIITMNAEKFTNYILQHKGEDICFALDKDARGGDDGEYTNWFFVKVIDIPQYGSQFILIDYAGGGEAYAIDLTSGEELAQSLMEGWFNQECEIMHGSGPDVDTNGERVVYVEAIKKNKADKKSNDLELHIHLTSKELNSRAVVDQLLWALYTAEDQGDYKNKTVAEAIDVLQKLIPSQE